MENKFKLTHSGEEVCAAFQLLGDKCPFSFLELEPPTRLTFMFNFENNPEYSLYVEANVESVGAGSELTLSYEVANDDSELKKRITLFWQKTCEDIEVQLSNKKAQASAGKKAIPKDSLGNDLSEGDSVKTIKDLNVKGSSMVIKRGTIVKKIHLVDGNDEEVDCKVDGVALALETRWLAKV